MTVGVLLKRVDLRFEVDPLTGERHADAHGGISAADAAALECALRHAETARTDVLAVSAGPAAADDVLRDALAAGASRAVRVDLPGDAESLAVASAVVPLLRHCTAVWCGDSSADRGSASVPGLVAGLLDIDQALGLVAVEVNAEGVRAQRRLDGGRREVLAVSGPAVLSVEAGAGRLRRAALGHVLAARSATVDVVDGPVTQAPRVAVRELPFRPRARMLPGPDPRLPPRERALALTGVLVEREPPRVVVAEPPEAAREIVDFLRGRGFLS